MAVLVDTGAVELLRRGNQTAGTITNRHFPPILCVHVAGEFLYGQEKAGKPTASLRDSEEFLGTFAVLEPSMDTARIYSELRADLHRRGITISDPDCWIAAHALEDNLLLLTTDRDFSRIPEVRQCYISPDEKSH